MNLRHVFPPATFLTDHGAERSDLFSQERVSRRGDCAAYTESVGPLCTSDLKTTKDQSGFFQQPPRQNALWIAGRALFRWDRTAFEVVGEEGPLCTERPYSWGIGCLSVELRRSRTTELQTGPTCL